MYCKAKRVNDELHCHHCRTVWDVNDPEPPACLAMKANGQETLQQLKDTLSTAVTTKRSFINFQFDDDERPFTRNFPQGISRSDVVARLRAFANQLEDADRAKDNQDNADRSAG